MIFIKNQPKIFGAAVVHFKWNMTMFEGLYMHIILGIFSLCLFICLLVVENTLKC